MRAALSLGEESLQQGDLPVGAVVVRDGAIVGRGRKRRSAHHHFDHAEIEAMRDALKRPERPGERLPHTPLTLYATLEPCIMCFGTALHTQFSRVVFALEDPGAGATRMDLTSLPRRHRDRIPQVVGGMLRDETMALFRRFMMETANIYWRDPEVPLVRLVGGWSVKNGLEPPVPL